jgi:hypothetical protein
MTPYFDATDVPQADTYDPRIPAAVGKGILKKGDEMAYSTDIILGMGSADREQARTFQDQPKQSTVRRPWS